tara:strand:- start:14593 stop:15924 length:1332 start_codon:yes stop_codon:yes gene_type:complete
MFSDTINKRIEDRDFIIGIIGLGYVGLPLLHTFHKSGFPVVGFDVDKSKISSIQEGISYIKHFSKEDIQSLADSKRCKVTVDFSELLNVDAILICVPTPLNIYREPDMSYVESTTNTISKYLKKNQLIVLESTTWPGTTDHLMKDILEKNSGLNAGVDFYLAYSPEREDPGNQDFNTQSIPKVVGASDQNSRKFAVSLYSSALDKVIPVSSAKVAEASKLLENIFRSVNIALVNEMKIIMDAMGIDIHEVIEAAATKPFGFMKFTPGPGLGGHCIPIDPFYLSWKAKEYGLNTRFIELAGEVNNAMPQYVVDKTILALNSNKTALNGSNILIIGIAYKPDVDDMRESPSFTIMDSLRNLGASIDFYDPWIPKIPKSRQHMNWYGKESIEWNKETISGYDAIVIVTDHKIVNYNELLNWNKCIVDSRNIISKLISGKHDNVFKA